MKRKFPAHGSLLLGVAFIATWACNSAPNDVTCGDGTRLEDNVCMVSTAGTGERGSESAGGRKPTQAGAGGNAGSGAGHDPFQGGAPEAGTPASPDPETTAPGGAPAEGGTPGTLGDGGESGGDECTPGTSGCACVGQRCSGGLACRDRTCVAAPKAPQIAVPGHYQLPSAAVDFALDGERHRLFASYGGEGVIRALDLDDGEVTTVPTGYDAEQLAFDAARDVVLVSLAVADRSTTYDYTEGWVAVIDATTLGDPKRIWVPLDPRQITGDGRGHAIVTGPSRQYTSIASANIDTGWFQTIVAAAERTSIRAHPDGLRIYGADSRGYPSLLERYDLSESGALSRPVMGRYYPQATCSDLRVHPSGKTIYMSCGDILWASNETDTDMTQAGSLSQGWSDLTFDESGRFALAVTWQGLVYRYDTTKLQEAVPLEPTSELGLGAVNRIFSGPGYLVLVRQHETTEVDVVSFDK